MEGKIYGTPKFQGKWPSTNTVMFINQTWLDNLGLEMPTTYTEFKEVLTAFKEQMQTETETRMMRFRLTITHMAETMHGSTVLIP